MTTAATVSEARIFWERVVVLTTANLKSRYRKTWAGFLWVVLNPLIMYGVQAKIFGTFLKLNVPNYSLFLLSGLLPWIFITQTLEMGTGTFQYSGRMLKSFQIPPLVYLLSQLLDNLINFLAAFFLILIPLLFSGDERSTALLLLPLPLVSLVIGVLAMTWILATLQVFFRDTRFVLSFTLSVAYYVTPIFYPMELVPERYRWIVKANPLYHLIRPFRVVIYEFNLATFGQTMLVSVGLSAGLFVLATLIWKRKQNEIYFKI